MSASKIKLRRLILFAALVPLVLLFFYVVLRSGPLAPVEVMVATVSTQTIRPAVFGVGTVEARYSYQVGPTAAGRIKQLYVQVGDRVRAGQLLGEMDPVDLNDRLQAQQAAVKRAEANVQDAEARQRYAHAQAKRYGELLPLKATSEEIVSAKRQELQTADAALIAAREERSRLQSEYTGLRSQQGNLHLVAPVAGLITLRGAEPGTTVVAGQTVIELIDPASVWVNTRFDQIAANGLKAGLPARIELRSRKGMLLSGTIARIEPKADSITEEVLAKVLFARVPENLPPLGELAEVTIDLPPAAATLVLPNAALHRLDNRTGVWRVSKAGVEFVAVKPGATDLDGRVQILEGLQNGDQVVLYSAKALTRKSRIKLVEKLSVGRR
ncbi:efflux RND transporter periplasmic adaptor subunit [Trichlorobacter lovleyi]|uniref:efflux RND transporter periplasmic adaptor subunit n=1 Tax=Trichlorobacter lovleyi TaxID=313985 RepID=UPI00223EB455|nr:efflux RND transporter periplasmic adaptor subunit [Trichlorobacter lovleyi]QOX78191.1 efflux RND transporter periplasmic adaptor subunit [Trichlorobacter lovleyi]